MRSYLVKISSPTFTHDGAHRQTLHACTLVQAIKEALFRIGWQNLPFLTENAVKQFILKNKKWFECIDVVANLHVIAVKAIEDRALELPDRQK